MSSKTREGENRHTSRNKANRPKETQCKIAYVILDRARIIKTEAFESVVETHHLSAAVGVCSYARLLRLCRMRRALVAEERVEDKHIAGL